MAKRIIPIFIALVLVGGLIGGGIYVSRTANRPVVISHPVPTIAVTPTPAKNITVTEPIPNSEIGYTVTVKGQARVFENQFSYRIKDFQNNILASGSVSSDATDAGQFGSYTFSATYKTPKTAMGVIELFDSSPKDGVEVDKVTLPVKFPTSPSTTLKIYFSKKDPSDCNVVYPSNRVMAKTATPARDALGALLTGPTDTEQAQGYQTSINPGVKIQQLTIENGIAKVDFDQTLQDKVGGSCRVAAIRAQITQTLKQFPTVKSVVISINGDSRTILQP
jgi:hypothetical protein